MTSSRERGLDAAPPDAAIPLSAMVGWASENPGELPGAWPYAEMVLIPGGKFLMGSDTEGDHAPAHEVRVEAFYLDAHEVTNAEYHEFCQATGHRLPEFWGIDARRAGPRVPGLGVPRRSEATVRTASVSSTCPGMSSNGSQTDTRPSTIPRAQ
ncbi:MAG: SUMF1/EgtB/PvdO family nonheme iron enzyme [Gemmatimonadota bacterium]